MLTMSKLLSLKSFIVRTRCANQKMLPCLLRAQRLDANEGLFLGEKRWYSEDASGGSPSTKRLNFHETRKFIENEYVPTVFDPNANISDFLHQHQDRFEQGILLRVLPTTLGLLPSFKGMMYYKSLVSTGKLLLFNRHITKQLCKNIIVVEEKTKKSEPLNKEREEEEEAQDLLVEEVTLKILAVEEHVQGADGPPCTDYNVHDVQSDKVVVKWELCFFSLLGEHAAGAGAQQANHLAVRQKGHANVITGVFIFELNAADDRILVHTVDNVVWNRNKDKEHEPQDAVDLLFF